MLAIEGQGVVTSKHFRPQESMMMKKVYGSLRIAWLSSDCYSQNSLVTSHACGEEFNVSAKASASLPSPMKSKCKMNTATLHSICMLVMIFLLLPASIDGLNCYQCYSNTLDPCSYEDYRPCPGLHNRCAIRTRRVHTGELFVKRECSLGCGDGIDTWSTRDLNVSR